MLSTFENASGFIFDCDGCLLDSMPTWRKVELDLIGMTGVEFTQAMLEDMRADPLDRVAQVLHQEYGVMESEEAILDHIDGEMRRFYEVDAVATPGAGQFLEELFERGIPRCVVSATPQAYVEAGLATCGLLHLVDFVMSTKETGISKQDPRIFQMALSKMDARASGAWGADDSLYAIKVMDSCGMFTIGTYDTDVSGSHEDLEKASTMVIDSFEELL